MDFNPRSLAGATIDLEAIAALEMISIHAPSRERPRYGIRCSYGYDFNPRSLAGATGDELQTIKSRFISIHAPSRERPALTNSRRQLLQFQSTLPRGSDITLLPVAQPKQSFQSTLPRGSDVT